MTLKSILLGLDFLHSVHTGTRKRDLKGSIFGVEVPAWIIFHTVLAYLVLGAGLCAIVLTIPIKPVKRVRWLHPHVGYVWIFGTIWLPVTAIWCVYSFTGWDFVAFFIFSMYAAVQLGWLCMRYYNVLRSKGVELPSTNNSDDRNWRRKIWKWLHGVFMVYSFCMLLGAGISFPFRAIDDFNYD